MCPKTDTTQEQAAILAVLQGKESPAAVDRKVYTALFDQVYTLYLDNHVAVATSDGYTIKHNPPKWSRRVR